MTHYLNDMKIRDIMITDVITIPITATYEEAARILFDKKINGAAVVDEKGRLAGMISEKDLFRVLYPFPQSYYNDPESYLDLEERESKASEIRNKPIAGFMSKNPVTIGPDVPVMHASALMLAKRVHRLPVIENGKLIGNVTRGLIYRAILKHEFGW
jgi:CBS domain-containing protein